MADGRVVDRSDLGGERRCRRRAEAGGDRRDAELVLQPAAQTVDGVPSGQTVLVECDPSVDAAVRRVEPDLGVLDPGISLIPGGDQLPGINFPAPP